MHNVTVCMFIEHAKLSRKSLGSLRYTNNFRKLSKAGGGEGGLSTSQSETNTPIGINISFQIEITQRKILTNSYGIYFN